MNLLTYKDIVLMLSLFSVGVTVVYGSIYVIDNLFIKPIRKQVTRRNRFGEIFKENIS